MRGLPTILLRFLLACSPPASGQTLPIPALPLRNSDALDTLIGAIGNARIVVLGEASHGTSDYHTWRRAITRRLVRERGFNCIAIEGEWADTYSANGWIRSSAGDSASAVALLQGFTRWPSWMWGNYETLALLRWLHAENSSRSPEKMIGLYGLDLYCIPESLDALARLRFADTAIQAAIRNAKRCFSPYGPDAMSYARAIRTADTGCANEAARLRSLILSQHSASPRDEAQFAREQYALVVDNGERYFRNIGNSAAAWNLREQHMYHTIRRLLDLYGPRSRIIVWAHNTHAGDARASTMSTRRKVSLGQLLRQGFGEEEVFITGFGSYAGTVLCGSTWGDTLRRVALPPARPGSWEDQLHRQYGADRLILCRPFRDRPGLNGTYPTRAVGVVYVPASDAYSSYTPSIMARRFDAYIYLDKTEALHPLPSRNIMPEAPVPIPPED